MMNAAVETVSVECPKCSGKGRLQWAGHVDNGRCFTCAGSGRIQVDAALQRRTEQQKALGAAEHLFLSEMESMLNWDAPVCPRSVSKIVDALLAAGPEARARVAFWRDQLDLSGCYGAKARAATAKLVRAVIAEGRARRAAA